MDREEVGEDAEEGDEEAAGSGKQDVAVDRRDPHASGSAEAVDDNSKWWISRSKSSATCAACRQKIPRFSLRLAPPIENKKQGWYKQYHFSVDCLKSIGFPPPIITECKLDVCNIPAKL